MHLLVNELCEYQNARCNDKNDVVSVSANYMLITQILIFQ